MVAEVVANNNLDIVGGKCNGMERAACPLGGGNTCGNEEGMEGFGTI